MRFLVSGPVSSIFCLPTRPKRGSSVGSSVSVATHLQHAARAELRAELGILRVVRILRLVLGVEVIEIAEELVEAVDGRQELVAVAEMVLAELAGGVALRLEQLGERRVLLGQSFLGARQADLEQAGAEATLPGDERGASGGAGLLGVEVGEDRAFFGDAVDVGRAVAHLAAVVGAGVPVADVVAEDDEDVRRFGSPARPPCSPPRPAARQRPAKLPSRIVRRSMPRTFGVWSLCDPGSSSWRLLLQEGQRRTTQRKPMCDIEVSIICGWRAAGRKRRQ